METTIQTTTRHSVQQTAKSVSSYEKFIAGLKFSYFGIITMTILIGSMLGSLAAMFILKADAPIWELGLCMAVSMANNVAAIGQAPMKWVVNIFAANVVVNLALILINVI